MFLTVALAGSAPGQERASSQDTIVAPDNNGYHTVKQFNGTLTASENMQIFGDPPLFSVIGSGAATTTQLGQFTVIYTFIASLSALESGEMAIGASNFIAADGIIYTYSTGMGSPSGNPDVTSVVERHTIAGGTGRYAHAKGSFTLNRLVNDATGVSNGSFHGFIILRNNHGH